MAEDPTLDHLRQFPLRPRVAFASRCAMRVRSAYTSDLPQGDLLDEAIAVTLQYARGESIDFEGAKALADKAADLQVGNPGLLPPARHAVRCIVLALGAAFESEFRLIGKSALEDPSTALDLGLQAAESAFNAYQEASQVSFAVKSALADDFAKMITRLIDVGEPFDASTEGPLNGLS